MSLPTSNLMYIYIERCMYVYIYICTYANSVAMERSPMSSWCSYSNMCLFLRGVSRWSRKLSMHAVTSNCRVNPSPEAVQRNRQSVGTCDVLTRGLNPSNEPKNVDTGVSINGGPLLSSVLDWDFPWNRLTIQRAGGTPHSMDSPWIPHRFPMDSPWVPTSTAKRRGKE